MGLGTCEGEGNMKAVALVPMETFRFFAHHVILRPK